MSKPFLFVYGNCQTTRLLQGLARHPDLPRLFNLRRVPNFKAFDKVGKALDVQLVGEFEREAGNCRAFIYQAEAWDKNSHLITDRLPADCIRIPIFSIAMTTLWPFYFKDLAIRKGRVEGTPELLPYGDSFITRRVKAGCAVEDIVREYTTMDVNSVIPLDEWRATNLAMLRKKEESAAIRVSDYIEERFETELCFWASNHPTNALIRQMLSQVLGALEVGDLDEKTGQMFTALPGLSTMPHHPVHPNIIEHFGLSYYGPDPTYSHYGQSLTFEAWARLYAATAMEAHGRVEASATALPAPGVAPPDRAPAIPSS